MKPNTAGVVVLLEEAAEVAAKANGPGEVVVGKEGVEPEVKPKGPGLLEEEFVELPLKMNIPGVVLPEEAAVEVNSPEAVELKDEAAELPLTPNTPGLVGEAELALKLNSVGVILVEKVETVEPLVKDIVGPPVLLEDKAVVVPMEGVSTLVSRGEDTEVATKLGVKVETPLLVVPKEVSVLLPKADIEEVGLLEPEPIRLLSAEVGLNESDPNGDSVGAVDVNGLDDVETPSEVPNPGDDLEKPNSGDTCGPLELPDWGRNFVLTESPPVLKREPCGWVAIHGFSEGLSPKMLFVSGTDVPEILVEVFKLSTLMALSILVA